MKSRALFEDLKTTGLSEGISSVAVKAAIAGVRLWALRAALKTGSESEFFSWTLFLGFVSVLPFLDFGIGGLSFRKKMLVAILNEPQEEQKRLFSETFFRLLQLYFLYAIFLLFLPLPMTWKIGGIALFCASPFRLITETLFAHSQMRLAYGIEFFEQMALAIQVSLMAPFARFDQVLIGYSLVFFCFHLSAFILFCLKNRWKEWNFRFGIFFNLSEAGHAVQAVLSTGFLFYFPYLMKRGVEVEDFHEFQVSFRLMSVGLGAALVFFNRLGNGYFIAYRHQESWPFRSYAVLLTGLFFFSLAVYGSTYPKIFHLFSGNAIVNPALHHQLFIWMWGLLLFYGLDGMMKQRSIQNSIFAWSNLYFTTIFFERLANSFLQKY